MKHAPLTIHRLAIKNLKGRFLRSICLILIVFVLGFSLFAGTILTLSLKNGLNSLQQRLGADVLVVPKGTADRAEAALISGSPNYFYFSPSVENQVTRIDGVSRVTSQFFLASMTAECCSEPVQLIGFDPKTDFVIQPWIAKTYGGAISDGQLVAGSSITLGDHHTIKLFNHIYTIAAQLDATSTGLDNSIFMTMNTIQTLLGEARGVGMHFLSETQPEGSISAVLVKVDPSSNIDDVAGRISDSVSDVDVIVSNSLISSESQQLGSLSGYLFYFTAVLWFLAVVVLTVIFTVTANERKKEFSVLRIIGATRRTLIRIVLRESLLISVVGGLVGTGAASLIVLPFSDYIGQRLRLPYLQPDGIVITGVLTVCLLLSFIVGPLASIYSAVKISRAETYLTMREGE